jgi:hypothetical protein
VELVMVARFDCAPPPAETTCCTTGGVGWVQVTALACFTQNPAMTATQVATSKQKMKKRLLSVMCV